jgi:hypothetical protein
MPDMSTHARDAVRHKSKPRSRADLWFVLILTGLASSVLQMYHATHAGGTVWLIAGIVGLVPSATAIGLSHVVAGHKSATVLRVITLAVMVAAMAASASAVAAVVRPIDGPWFSWVFGVALDAAALACVWVLLGEHDRQDAEVSALQVAEQSGAEARAAAAESAVRAAGLEAELTAARAALEAERARRVPDRKPRRNTARKPARASAVKTASGTGGTSGPEDLPDIDAEARILQLIAGGMSASAAGVAAGKSDSYGRYVARLARAAQEEPAGDQRTAGDMASREA